MDVTTPLIFLSIFVLASLSLFLVYKYGMKKKSYEEALAEHRKITSALIGTKPKPNKEKKSKKAAKKVNKETKPNKTVESEISEDLETVDAQETEAEVEEPVKGKDNGPKGKGANKSKEKVHVEFKPEPEEVPVVEPPVEKEVVNNKKKSKKVRPILLKSTSELEFVLPADIETPVLNHFEDIHPKDDCELLLMHANSKEEIAKPAEDNKKPNHKKNKHKPQEGAQIEEPASVAEKETPKEEPAPVVVHEPLVNTAKEKKKKKSELANSRQQIINREKRRVAERDQLIHSVRIAELSRTEVQMLIDLLLNKQLEAPTVVDDWSEGKSDPIQKLKKQLADKEKQLKDEQEALLGVQAKLKEIRHEQQTERAQLQLKLKQSEEARLDAVATRNRTQQSLQELEEFRNNFQRVVEENKVLMNERARLEATLIGMQETEAVLHNLKSENAHLNNELHRLTQERQDQDLNLNNCVIQMQTMQEELQRNHSFALAAQQEEIRQLAEKLQVVVQEEQRLKDFVSQLETENRSLHEENSKKINGSLEETKEHKIKLLNLTNELSSVKSDLSTATGNLLEAERQHRETIAVTQQQCEQLKGELEEQKNKNNELRKKNWKVMEALNEAESRKNKESGELQRKEQNAHKQFLQRLFPEVEEVKTASFDANWQLEVEKGIRKHIANLQQNKSSGDGAEVVKLQAEVLRYKRVIDETEGMLTNLESYIQQEERTLRGRLAEKDSEIQELKGHFAQLQIKLSTLEDQLTHEQSEKSRLLAERQQAINRPESKAVLSDSTATIEKLSEEVDRLKEQLRLEQVKNKEVTRLVYQNGEAS